MNKVFKVIWSEARNAYVVVSEIAKNHGSKSCSTKKLLTMLIATGVMTCASMAPAMADNPAPDDKNIAIGSGASTNTYNYNNVYGDKPITGDIAIGQKAYAWNGGYNEGQDIYIGTHEYYMDFGQGGIVLDHSTWRKDYYKVVDGSKVAGSIAIGKNSVARTGSTILGDHTYNGKIGDTEITSKTNYMNIQPAVFSTTIGSNTYNAGTLATVTGAFSIASSQFNGSGNTNTKNYGAQNTGATIYGSMNSIESATSNDWATRRYSGIASSVLGFANRTQNANAALIWGTGNEITNSIEAVTGVDFTKWNSMSVSDAQKDAIKAMQSNQYAGGSVMAIGGGNKADYATYSELTGVQNKVTGTKAKAAKYDFVNGYQNTVTNASDVTVIGIKNEVTADGNKVIGDNHKVSGKNNVIFGSADKVTETTVNNAVVLGHNAKVTGEGGVALGAGSVANRANAVYVGSKDANRQIINVAAGKEDTDAVNVSQLKDVKAEALKHSTVTNGANITVTEGLNKDGGKEYNVALNNDIHLFGDNDAMVSISGSKGTIWTSGSVTAGSVAVGTAKADGTTPFFVDSNGAFYAADSKFSVDKDGNANANSVQTNALNAKYNLSVGTANENGTVPFFVNSNGAFYAANGKLVVDKDGKVTATEGEIGNVVLKNGVYTGHSALRDAELFVGDADGNYSQITPKSAKLGQVTIDEKGNIAGVNSIQTNALNAKYNLSVGTANENGIMPFFVNSNGAFYGANNNFSVDKDGKVTATAGEIGNVVLQNGVFTGHSALRDGELFVGDASGNYSQITTKGAKLGKVTVAADGKISGVAAGAAALAALHPMDFDPDDKLTFSAGYGNYGGENAAAIGAYYRPDEKVMFSVGGTVGNGENMVNAGVSFALDRTNHVSNSRTALAREVIDLRGQLAVMGAKMAKMEKAFGMLDETKTKLFPDIPANHWAYEYIAKLAGNGYIEGYPDGNFGGDRLMTRYEFAAMLYRAIENGAALEEKIIKEFEPELGRIRVDRISGEDGDRDKIERVRVNDTKGERDHYGNKLAK